MSLELQFFLIAPKSGGAISSVEDVAAAVEAAFAAATQEQLARNTADRTAPATSTSTSTAPSPENLAKALENHVALFESVGLRDKAENFRHAAHAVAQAHRALTSLIDKELNGTCSGCRVCDYIRSTAHMLGNAP